MTKKYRNPYVRRATPKNMVLELRDVDIIEAVYRYRVLKQIHIQSLFFGSASGAKYRLERLYDSGYLERKPLPRLIGGGRQPILYILDKRGAEVLKSERGYEGLRWYPSSKDVTDLFLEHTIAINDFMVSLGAACGKHSFEIESWQTENEIKADFDRVNVKVSSGKHVSTPILPDAIFSFIAFNQRNRCFLEVDRGTEKVENFKNKIRAYIAYHESGKYEARYHATAMRVLTVISTRYSGEKRLESLKRATEEAGGKRRFWFATAKSITAENVLFDPIWYLASELEPKGLVKLPEEENTA
jgi:hypothetical protein